MSNDAEEDSKKADATAPVLFMARPSLPCPRMPFKIVVSDGLENSDGWHWKKNDQTLSDPRLGRLFDGRCYNCGQTKHSQNFCPLKLCSACGKYGHGDRTCWSLRRDQQQPSSSSV